MLNKQFYYQKDIYYKIAKRPDDDSRSLMAKRTDASHVPPLLHGCLRIPFQRILSSKKSNASTAPGFDL